MPEITPNLGLKKPLGNENVNRAAYNENLDLIDANAAKKTDLTAHLADNAAHGVNGKASKTGDTFTGQVTVESGTYPPLRARNNTDLTNTNVTGLDVISVSSGDMANLFGSGITLSIQDNEGVANIIGALMARRNGADNSGDIYLRAFNAGAGRDVLKGDKDGAVTLPFGPLQIVDANRKVHKVGTAFVIEDLTGNTGIESGNKVFLTSNCYQDATGQWQRYSTTSPATLFMLENGNNIRVYKAAAGANPIVWNGPFEIYHADNYNFGKLVGEIVVTGAAVTSVQFTGLDANAHGGYILVYDLCTTASYCHLGLGINGDTTPLNYINHNTWANNSAGQGRGNTNIFAVLTTSNQRAFGEALINISPTGYAHAISNGMDYDGAGLSQYTYVVGKTATVANITSITLTATLANAIGINSKFKLYRRA